MARRSGQRGGRIRSPDAGRIHDVLLDPVEGLMEEGEALRPVNLRHDIHQIRVVRMRNEGFRMASSEARMGRWSAPTELVHQLG